MKKKYRVAIVGCGRIGSEFDDDPKRKQVSTHAGAYSAHPEIEFVAVSDIDKNRLEKSKKRWNVPNAYTDYKEMLRKENIEILSICTWSKTHFEIFKEAVKYGLKAVFCEKPISTTLSEADEMVRICEQKDIVLAVNHSRRWDKFEQKIRDYIYTGKLGSIQNVSAYYTAGITNTGIHLLDLLRFLFGDAEWVWVSPDIRIDTIDPVVDGYIYFKAGFGCSLHGLDVNNYLIFEIDIYGTKGRLRIKNSGFDSKFWSVSKNHYFSGYKELKERKSPFGNGYKDVLKNAIKDIIGCLESKRHPISSGKDGVKALELICAVHESLRHKGKKIKLPLKNRNIAIRTR